MTEEQRASRKAYLKAYRERNRERLIEREKERRAANPDVNRQRCRDYRAKNLEQARAKDRERYTSAERVKQNSANGARWREQNPELHRLRRREWYAANAELCRERARLWQAANPDRIKDRNLKKRGFTLHLKRAAIELQGHKCAICQVDLNSLPPKKVCADHCHKTGSPRGILCSKCNSAIGYFKDDPQILRAAIDYLEKPPLADASD